jgi:hypothetical protein
MMDINFETVRARQTYDASWRRKIEAGDLTKKQVRAASESQLGVIRELNFVLRADKSHLMERSGSLNATATSEN